jgi:hypothetical protein
MRYACKWRLRQALYHGSRTSIQHDVAARAYYGRLRRRWACHCEAQSFRLAGQPFDSATLECSCGNARLAAFVRKKLKVSVIDRPAALPAS